MVAGARAAHQAGGGGWLIAQGQMGSLHWFGLVGMLAAMAMSWWASRQRAHTGASQSA